MSAAPHLLHVFSTFAAAGPQIRTVHLIEALGEAYRHTVVACDGRGEALELVRRKELVRLAPPPPERRGWRALPAMRRLLAEQAPDLLLTYNWGSLDAVLAARFRPGLPLLHHEDGFNADEAGGQKLRRVLARRFALARAAKVVVPSGRLHAIARESWRIADERLEWIPNGIDLEVFQPGPPEQALRERLGLGPEDLLIGSVGHLRAVKNYARLIEAASRIRPAAVGGRAVHLLLIGDGAERDELERRARCMPPPGGKVHFVGHQAALAPWYRSLDLFALSSDSEQHPVALIEAMACALPFVATDVGDVRIVAPTEQQGTVLPLSEGVASALAEACERLLASPAERARLGAANRARAAERYSFAAMLARYRAVYEECLASRRR